MIKMIKEKRGGFPPLDNGLAVTFLNPYSYLVARENKSYFDRVDVIHCDGFLLSVLLGLTGEKFPRISFDMTSLAPVVFERASNGTENVFFVGGLPGVVDAAENEIKKSYPRLKVCGLKHGYFDDNHDRQQCINDIILANPDVVVVGLGTPLQEKFLIDLRDAGWKGTGYTCGGFFHQTASKGVNYYPGWIDKLNLRWLYRMVDEPKLIRRYLLNYPKFLLIFLYDLGCFYLDKPSKTDE